MLPFTASSGLVANISLVITSAIILVSFGFMLYKHHKKNIPLKTLLPFLLNFGLFLNLFILSFIPTNDLITALSIMLLPFTTLWGIIVAWKKYRWVSVINILFELFLLYVIAMLALVILVLATRFQ